MTAVWQYQPLEEFPHLPRNIVVKRMAKKTVATPAGCLLWVGGRRDGGRGVGVIRAQRPQDGKGVYLFTNKLAWWVAHGTYPTRPAIVVPDCGHPHCVAIDHLRIKTSRQLSSEQVAEARRLYWAPWARVNKTQRQHKPPSVEQLAAWDTGLHIATVRQVVAGRPVAPHLWRGHVKSPQDVLAAAKARVSYARQKQEDHAAVCGQEHLAATFGISLASMHLLLHGITYADVPMPPEADAKVQWDAQVAHAARLQANEQGAVDPADTSAIIEKNENHRSPTGPPAQDVSQRSQLAGYAAIHV